MPWLSTVFVYSFLNLFTVVFGTQSGDVVKNKVNDIKDLGVWRIS